jgi:putative transposase
MKNSADIPDSRQTGGGATGVEATGFTHPAGHRALRRGRHSLTGQIYLITFVTSNRERLFDDAGNAAIVARASEDGRLWYRSRLLAWVLMPDHWHGMVELGDLDDISIVVQRLKTNTAKALRRYRSDGVPVWAKGFHDRALRADENLRAAARYLIANPLRAGLVTRIGDYPYWNAIWL